MQPSIGCNVHYQRAGRTFCALITRVEKRPMPPEVANASGFDAANAVTWLSDEKNYEVWLAVFVHTSTIGDIQFSPNPVPYSATPADQAWFWPPRVA